LICCLPQEIPSTGIDKWFSLEGRSENSKVHGQIHIRANLATREDRGISEEDNWTDIKQHVELLQIFIDHELNKFKVSILLSKIESVRNYRHFRGIKANTYIGFFFLLSLSG